MMRPINLIPAARIEQRRRRALHRRCAVGCTAYAIAALAGGIACHVVWGSPKPHLAEWLDETANKVSGTEKTIAAVRLDLEATQQTLRASKAISEQPDW